MLILARRQSGFSLIELMIGLALLALLLALGVPSFSAWIQSSQIRTAAEAIQNGLNLARSEAVRRNTSVQFVSTGTAWQVACTTPVADVDGDGVADCPGLGTIPETIQSRDAGEGSANAVADASPTVVFTGLGRTTSLVDVAINITNPGGGTCAATGGPMRCLRVVVTSMGQIRMCDPALTITRPTDPQAC